MKRICVSVLVVMMLSMCGLAQDHVYVNVVTTGPDYVINPTIPLYQVGGGITRALQRVMDEVDNQGVIDSDDIVHLRLMEEEYNIYDEVVVNAGNYDRSRWYGNSGGSRTYPDLRITSESTSGRTTIRFDKTLELTPHSGDIYKRTNFYLSDFNWDIVESGWDSGTAEGQWLDDLIDTFDYTGDAADEWRWGESITRSDCIFVDDVPMALVGTYSALEDRPNSFYYNAEDHIIYIHTTETVTSTNVHFSYHFGRDANDPQQNTPGYGLRFYKMTNLILRDIDFKYYAGLRTEGMVSLSKLETALVDNSTFNYSTGVGLKLALLPYYYDETNEEWVPDNLSSSYRVELSDVSAHWNGIYGISCGNSRWVQLNDCDVKYNNWKGYYAGTVVWALGGSKFHTCRHVQFNRVQYNNNFGLGLWCDNDQSDLDNPGSYHQSNSNPNGSYIDINDSEFNSNLTRGLFLETCSTNNTVDGSELASNGRCADDPDWSDLIENYTYGCVIIRSTKEVTFTDCTFNNSWVDAPIIFFAQYQHWSGVYNQWAYGPAANNYFTDCLFIRSSDDTYFRAWENPSRCFECSHLCQYLGTDPFDTATITMIHRPNPEDPYWDISEDPTTIINGYESQYDCAGCQSYDPCPEDYDQ